MFLLIVFEVPVHDGKVPLVWALGRQLIMTEMQQMISPHIPEIESKQRRRKGEEEISDPL